MERYSLKNIQKDQLSITKYILKGMKELKYGPLDIKEFQKQMRNSDYYEMLEIAEDYVKDLNLRYNSLSFKSKVKLG